MKVNIKGLAFVGFAAAIFAASAHADTEQEIAAKKKTVTSQYYAEQTYQAKSDKVTGTGADTIAANDTNDTKFATPKAVVQYVGAQAGASDFTGAGENTAGAHGLVPAPASGKTTDYLKGNGSWQTPDSAATENSTNLITSGAVKTYADSKVASASTVGTSTTVAPNEKAVSDALAGKQGNLGGTANQIPVTTTSAGTVNYKNIESTAANVDTTTHADSIPTTGAVAGAISSAISNLNSGGTYEVTENKAESIIDSGEGANASSTTEYASNAAVTGWAQKKLSGTDGQLVTYGATAGAVGSATLGTAALTIKQNNVANSTTFGANATEAVTINLATPDWNAASDAAGYIANKPSVEVTGNKASTIVADGTANDTTSSTTLYTTNAAVTGYAQKKLGGTSADAGKVVTASATAGEVTYTQLATVATTGSYSNLSDKPAYDLPSIPSGTTCNASTPCALVLAGEAPTWVNMAQ